MLLQRGKPTSAKHTRTPATGPSPLSAKPAQADCSAGKGRQTSNGTAAAPSKDLQTEQKPAQQQVTNAFGQAEVGKRVQVYWDGEKAWCVICI